MADAINQTYATMASFLQSMGLGALAGTDANGQPSGWLWNALQSGVDTPDELDQAIQQTSIWKDRFAVIVQQRADAAAGKPVQVMTPAEVVAYENSAKQLMRNAGLPATFYDQPSDFNALMIQGISPAELNDRLGESFTRARNVSPEIRQAFESFYGVGQGDSALAAFFLDPTRTIDSLDRASRAAYAAGLGKAYGINDISKSEAEKLTTFAVTDSAVNQGLGQVAAEKPITTDNSLFDASHLGDETAIKSVFENDAAATSAINRRITERRSANTNSVGGAALTQQGLLGAGSAR